MKLMLRIVLATLVAIGMVACNRNKLAESSPIKVGVILPLTGSAAEPGKTCLDGIRLAVSNYNSQTLDQRIELIVEDSQSAAKIGVSAANKLIAVDHVKVILGDIMSSVAMAIAPIAEKQGVAAGQGGRSLSL